MATPNERAGIAAGAVIWALTVPVSAALGEPQYLGYAGQTWERDYGVLDGRCNRRAIGAVLVAGGAGGPAAARAKRPPVATVAGNVLGVAAGAGAGRDMDDVDRACLGHALELSGSERGVAWINPDNGAAYLVVPLGGFTDQGRSCREFVARVAAAGGSGMARRRACSAGGGEWRVLGTAAGNG